MKNSLRTVACISICCVLCSPAQARDVRALGMGGAAVSSGQGIGGAIANPSALMNAQRNKVKYQFGFGVYGTVRDSGGVIDDVADNENLIEDIEREIDAISQQAVTCIPGVDPADTACLSDTAALGGLAGDALDIFNTIDEEPLDGYIGGNWGFSVSHTPIPFYINLGMRVTGAARADITAGDKQYAETLQTVLGDGILTFAEIEESAPITLTAGNNSVNVSLPDDVLDSEFSGGAVFRTQLSLGLAKTFKLSKTDVDVGITPKISSLRASDTTKTVSELDDDLEITDELERDETTETTITFDIGASMALPANQKFRLAGLIKNVVPESIKTKNGFEFETTAQAIVSAMYADKWYKFTADLALNKAKEDNFETQKLSLGTELGKNLFHFRAGILHDLAVDNDPTELTLGIGIGFFDLAVGFNDSNASGGMQVSFSL